jgi:hypothetical protein
MREGPKIAQQSARSNRPATRLANVTVTAALCAAALLAAGASLGHSAPYCLLRKGFDPRR